MKIANEPVPLIFIRPQDNLIDDKRGINTA